MIKIVLTASLFAKSSTIFYQQQCCLKTATIACFFSKKRAVHAFCVAYTDSWLMLCFLVVVR